MRRHLSPLSLVHLTLMVLTPIAVCGQNITLPVDVVGPDGYTAAVSFTLPERDVESQVSLLLRVNNLSYDTKGAVQINDRAFIPLDNAHCTVRGMGATYGGIGGPTRKRGVVPTIDLVVAVPVGQLKSGENRLAFRFNHTDGVSSGYRIVKFNFRDATGHDLLPPNLFSQQDPTTFTAPQGTTHADVEQGRMLWHSAALADSPSNPAQLRAHCGDCHTVDGRDLKYFGFSNWSIITRSQFHGLSEAQGRQIAAFIRANPVNAQALPYAPVYQPGPGMSQKPLEKWAAGAGLDAVAGNAMQALGQIFPAAGKEPAADGRDECRPREMDSRGVLRVCDISLMEQLPDWNAWLPRIHPKDAFPGELGMETPARSGSILQRTAYHMQRALVLYDGDRDIHFNANVPMPERIAEHKDCRSVLAGHPSVQSAGFLIGQFVAESAMTKDALKDEYASKPFDRETLDAHPEGVISAEFNEQRYSFMQWAIVKTWEMHQEFGWEARAQNYRMPGGPVVPPPGYPGEERGWFAGLAFMVSPFQLGIPDNELGIGGSAVTNEYLANSWYATQLILNSGNRLGWGQGPTDWAYNWGKMKDQAMAIKKANSSYQARVDNARVLLNWVKALQYSDNGRGPHEQYGWNPDAIVNLLPLFDNVAYAWVWDGIPDSDRQSFQSRALRKWLELSRRWSPQQYWTRPGTFPIPLVNRDFLPRASEGGEFGNKLLFLLIPQHPGRPSRLQEAGMDAVLINQLVDFAASLYPTGYDRNNSGPSAGHPGYHPIAADWSELKVRG